MVRDWKDRKRRSEGRLRLWQFFDRLRIWTFRWKTPARFLQPFIRFPLMLQLLWGRCIGEWFGVLQPSLRDVRLKSHYHFTLEVLNTDISSQISSTRFWSHFLHKKAQKRKSVTRIQHYEKTAHGRYTYWVNNSTEMVSLLLEGLKLGLAPDWNLSLFRVICNQLIRQTILHIAKLAFQLARNILYRLSFLEIAWQKHSLELFLIFNEVVIVQIVSTMDKIIISRNRVELW